jgi:hypothetical protein
MGTKFECNLSDFIEQDEKVVKEYRVLSEIIKLLKTLSRDSRKKIIRVLTIFAHES